MNDLIFHPLPLCLDNIQSEECPTPPKDRLLGAWDVHFPIVPRRQARKALLEQGVASISMRFYQSQTNHAELFPKMQIQNNILGRDNSVTYLDASHIDHENTLETENTGRFWDDRIRSHPGMDVQGIWILELKTDSEYSCYSKTELSRIMKEICKYAWQVAESAKDRSNPFAYQHKEHVHGIDSPRTATMIWHLQEDKVSIRDIQECLEQTYSLQQSANSDDVQLSERSMEYLETYLKETQGLTFHEEGTCFEITLRENPLADPQAQNILDQICPVREIERLQYLNHTESTEDRLIQPNPGFSEVILDTKPTQALIIARKESTGISIHHLSLIQMILADPDKSTDLLVQSFRSPTLATPLDTPLEGTQSPGYGPSVDLESVTDRSKDMIEICHEFQKEIADCIREPDSQASEEDLQILEKFVHPLIPLAWKDESGYLHANLQNCIDLYPHWSLETLHKSSFQHGTLPPILEPEGRIQLAKIILGNILHHLDWPWETSPRPLAMEPFITISKLEEKIPGYAHRLQQALEQYLRGFYESQELAQIANQDPLLDFAKSAQYLEKYPEQKQIMRNYPVLLHIAAEEFSNGRDPGISLDEDADFRILEKALTETSDADGVPLLKWCFLHQKTDKAKIRKILRSTPVLAIQEQSASDPQLPPAWQDLCKSFREQPERIVERACKVNLEHIPETAAEWCLFQKICMRETISSSNADNHSWDTGFDRHRFWRSALEENRGIFHNPFPELDCRWQKQEQDLELIFQSAEKMQEIIAHTDSCLRITLENGLLPDSEYRDFIVASNKAAHRFQSITSMNKIRKICTSWDQHVEILKHIRDRAPLWPDESQKSKRSRVRWPRILKHPILSADSKYRILEIDNHQDLHTHSNKMKNCAWSYVRKCLDSDNPMHIMEVRCEETQNPVMTLGFRERGNRLSFVDAKGYENSDIGPELEPLSERTHAYTMKHFVETYNRITANQARQKMQRKYLAMTDQKSTAPQLLWQTLETWKVLRRIYSSLPELPDFTEQDILEIK